MDSKDPGVLAWPVSFERLGYLDDHGVNRTLWSGMTWQYWRETRSLKLAEYKFFGVGTGSSAKGRAVSV